MRYLLLAALPLTPAIAGISAWSFNFQQGVAEYAMGSFDAGGNSLALYCAESGVRPGTVSVSLRRAGFDPKRPTPATFLTERGRVTMTFDRDGSADFASLAAAPRFAALWRLLATSRTLRVRYGPGAPIAFPMTGAAKMLGPKVCPKQLA